MEIVKGRAVVSRAGRDQGRWFAVLSVEDGFATIADGDLRKLEKPKRKKLKHLGASAHMFDPGDLSSDKALRAAIQKRFCGEKPSKEA